MWAVAGARAARAARAAARRGAASYLRESPAFGLTPEQREIQSMCVCAGVRACGPRSASRER